MRAIHTNLAIPAFLLAALVVPAPARAADGWLTRVDEARSAAREHDRMILVDLYADWCGWCKKLERSVFSTPEFRAFASDFVLLRVDVEDGGEGTDLQARYGATSLPTTLILDPDMVRVGEVTGYAPTAAYVAAIEGQVEAWAGFLADYEKLRDSDDLDVLRTFAEELHDRGDGERAAYLYRRLREKARAGSPAAAWVEYLLADAYRLSGELARAEAGLTRARALAAKAEDPELVERVDLLSYRIAQDRGDCRQAIASLESFLENHPRSSLSTQARRTLSALRSGELELCT